MEKINKFYAKHPLVLPDGFHCPSVMRVFSDSKLSAGGRLYGAYSNHEQADRVSSTIDGLPVCEIDIRASQPTLLSSLLAFKIGVTWDDLYGSFPSVKGISDPIEKKKARDQVKAVVAELIGVGNADKTNPSKDLLREGVDEFRFMEIRKEATSAIPALAEMKKRRITSNSYLTFHESEIILGTIEELMNLNIPAFSVHDSIIVKQDDESTATEALRRIWSSYSIQEGDHGAKGVSQIYPSLSITYPDMSEKDVQGIWK